MVVGFWTLWVTPAVAVHRGGTAPTVTKEHFGGSAFALSKLGFDTKLTIYAGFVAVLVNLVVARRWPRSSCVRRTSRTAPTTRGPPEYVADRGDRRVHDLPTDEDVAPVSST